MLVNMFFVNQQWLSDDFTSYLDRCKVSVDARKGYGDAQKQRDVLGDLTSEGISLTGICTIIYILPHKITAI